MCGKLTGWQTASRGKKKEEISRNKFKEKKKRKFTLLGVITGASRPRGSPRLLS